MATITTPEITSLVTLQMHHGGLLDGEPVDYLVHLVRGTRNGTPGPTLCGIDRFAPSTPGWSVGGGVDGPGMVHRPCSGCVAVAGRDFPGLPVHGMRPLHETVEVALRDAGRRPGVMAPAPCAHANGAPCRCCERGECDCGSESQCACLPCYATDEGPRIPAGGLAEIIDPGCGEVAAYASEAGTVYAGDGLICCGCHEPGRVTLLAGVPAWVPEDDAWCPTCEEWHAEWSGCPYAEHTVVEGRHVG